MTDEMMVQAQKPSAMPYVLGGAGVGALGGLGSAKYANFGVPTPKYSSWEEAINDSNDEFVKKQIEKGGDKKADFEKLQNAQKEVKEAKENLNKALGDKLKDNADVKDYLKKAEEFDKAEAKLIKDLEARITKGEFDIKIEGDELAKKIAEDANVKLAKTGVSTTEALQINKITQDAELMKGLNTDAEKTAKARELLKAEAKETDPELLKNARKAVSDAQGKVKEAETAVEKSLSKSFKELKGAKLTEMAEKLLLDPKNHTDEYKKALEAYTDSFAKIESVEGVEEVLKANAKLKNVKDKFKNAFTDDFIKSMKTASIWKTALAGAAILGLAGYLFAPKGEKV